MNNILISFIFIFLFFSFFVFATEKIDINTASLQQLGELKWVGDKTAQKIIDARPFSSVDDLLRVSGIGSKKLQDIKTQGLACVNCQTQLTQPTPALSQTPTLETTPTPTPPAPIITYPSGIIINEILPSPDGADEENEWIELYNTNNFEVDLSSWKIKDKEGSITTYSLPENTKISVYGYLVFKRPDTKITLNNTTDGLMIYWPDEKIIDSMAYEKAPANQSYNRIRGNWQWSISPTPGAKNIITQNNDTQKSLSLSRTGATEALPKIEKSGSSKEVDVGLAAISQSINPWFLFLIAIVITIISTIIILILKIRVRGVKT